jgi:hypothetical protein
MIVEDDMRFVDVLFMRLSIEGMVAKVVGVGVGVGVGENV